MKIVIIAVIVLVVPLFFALMFVMSAYNRLSFLRSRCEAARACLNASRACHTGVPSAVTPEVHANEAALLMAVEEYNRERAQPAGRLVSTIFGFKDATGLNRGTDSAKSGPLACE